jgi:hypothetical protein
MICVTDPQEAAVRDAQLREAAAQPDAPEWVFAWTLGPGVHRDGDPVAGVLGIQARVAHNGSVARLDEFVGGARFTLLSPLEDPAGRLGAAAAAAWRRIGGVSVHVGSGPAYEDVDGHYAAWFAERDVEVVLVRPDFYIFGGGALEDTDELVRELVAALALRDVVEVTPGAGLPTPGP